MLTTRAAKRDKAGFFNADLMFDIFDEGREAAGQSLGAEGCGARVLAMAERAKQSFAVSRGEESFTFREVSRPCHLFPLGSAHSLGTVGREKLFTRTLRMNLPAEFEPAFQAFLLILLLNLTMEQLDGGSSYT